MTLQSPRTGRGRAPVVLAWLLVPLLLLAPGCHRRYYRKEADKEVFGVLGEKSDDARWNLAGFFVYPHPEARFADITNPDKPPMPPDDPAARDYSPNPQKPGKAGIARIEGLGYLALLDQWDLENRAEREARRKERTSSPPAATDANKAEPSGPDLPDADKANRKDEPKKDHPKSEEPKKDEPKKDHAKPVGAVVPTSASEGASSEDPSREGVFDALMSLQDLTSEQILELAENRARRELAGVVTAKGGVGEKEVEKAVSQERTFLLKLEQAVQLGLINSREYQTRREQVYLAALPVTLERFAFAPQFYAAETAFLEYFGSGTPEGLTRRWRFMTNLGVSQLFSTGALLLASFANETVVNLTDEPNRSVSNFALDLIQPLLRGGGRAVTLEPLTQAERSLLYAIRDFAFFRQNFYVYLAGGQPNISGSQVQGIEGATVQVPTRFVPGPTPVVGSVVPVRVAPQVVPGEGFRVPGTATPQAPNQGYLSTLAEKAQLINQYRNIISLSRFLRRFRVYLEGGIVNSVQVGQVEQQMLRSIENALNQQATYRTSIDQFKLQLGLPMNLRLEVADHPLEPMLGQTRRFEDISNAYEEVSNLPLRYVSPDEAGQLRGRLRTLLTDSAMVRSTRFAERILQQWGEWIDLPSGRAAAPGPLEQRLERIGKERDRLRERREQLREKERGTLSEDEERELARLEYQIDLGRFEQSLRNYERRLWEGEKDPYRRQTLQNLQFNVVYRLFLALLEEAFRERTDRVRGLWPNLPVLCVEGVDLLRDDDDKVLTTVTRVALENRLDLMNQRAQVVDSWRRIRVAANALLGTFNVQYHFDTNTPYNGSRPFNFGYNRNRNQLIFDTELPLVRIRERNEYRATLIAYQQQRRDLMAAEDQVVFQARQTLRQLRASANSYHNVQKRAVELAYIQVDQALQAFSQPQAPSGPALPAGSVGPPTSGGGSGDPAALTQQLLQTQNQLLQAQNTLYNTWISYLINRMSLYRDLGLMQLDPRGVWIDDIQSCHCPQLPVSGDGKSVEQPPGQLPALPGGNDGSGGDVLPAPRPVENAR